MRQGPTQKHLAALEAVVRQGSFAAAADELALTQSAISQQIAELEERVGMTVVERRPVRITEAGRVLLKSEQAIRAARTIAEKELTALHLGHAGTISLAAFSSVACNIVPQAVAEFRTKYPDVQFNLYQSETSDSYASLLKGTTDLAITFDYSFLERKPPAEITRTLVAKDHLVAVLPKSHSLVTRNCNSYHFLD